MYITHEASDPRSTRKILAEGIFPSNKTGNIIWRNVTNPDWVYLTLRTYDRDGDDAKYYVDWGGGYGFVLNDRWVKEHTDQFMENIDEPRKEYDAALGYYGITARRQESFHAHDRSYMGLVSTKPIPLEGLELLVVDSKKIHEARYAEFRKLLPAHMKLLLWDSKTEKIVGTDEPQKVY
jgi:hypothetical protein